MARAPIEVRNLQRDGTSQAQRLRPELAPGAIGIDERGAADAVSFARRFAAQLLWYDADNRPAGWWAAPEDDDGAAIVPAGEPPRGSPTMFDGIGPAAPGTASLSYDEVAAFLADPQAFPGERYRALRRPHMALLLTAIRLLRHGRDALNRLPDKHFEYHLREVLRLEPRPPEPDRAFVLFELATGVDEALAPAGLRLLAGRDARRRDRIYRLDAPVVVNRAKVARLASTFVEREVIGLAEARQSKTGTPEEKFLFLLSLALGDPKPGDRLPPFRRGEVIWQTMQDIVRFIAFPTGALFMELFELRALLARLARRGTEDREWQRINSLLELAGRAKRNDPTFKLQTAKPGDFAGNLALALQGPPDLRGLTEVVTVDDLLVQIDREEVRNVIATRLFMDPLRRFKPMMEMKRAIDTDWKVVNALLERAGRRKRPAEPNWVLPIADQANFAKNLATAVGPVDFAAAGPVAEGVTDLKTYMARLGEIEAWFFMAAEDVARLLATFGADEKSPAGQQAWREAHARLAAAHGRKVRAQEAAEIRRIRLGVAPSEDGRIAALEAALGDLPTSLDAQMEALARYASPEDKAYVQALMGQDRGSSSGWPRADQILAEARRKRLRLPEPVARKQHWRALWAYPDARSAKLGSGTGDGAETAWRCFGGVPDEAGPGQPPAGIGWAVASPALALSAGRRRITVLLGFHADEGGPLVAPVDDHGDSPAKIPFIAALSGEKDWIEPSSIEFIQVQPDVFKLLDPPNSVDPAVKLVLRVTLLLDESAPAIAPAGASTEFGGTPWPVLRLMLRPVWDPVEQRFETAYERFRSLKLARVQIVAAVGAFVTESAPGLWPLTVATDGGTVDGKKPFEPFGARPAVGSEVAFGHADLLHKRLVFAALRYQFLGGPEDLKNHYADYKSQTLNQLTAQHSLVDGGVRTIALGQPKPLFAGNDTRVPVRVMLDLAEAAKPDAVIAAPGDEVREWRRYLTMRLDKTDFGHSVYPSLVTEKAVELADKLRRPNSEVVPAEYAIKPPYTPKLARISLDFVAAHTIDVGRYDPATAVDHLFHVHPFGVAEALGESGGWPLLPAYDEEGALYVGLTGVDAPQSVSLLFAGVEGGGAEERTGALRWSYLSARGWSDFAVPPEDDTGGLARRGIVRFALPETRGDTRMPGGFLWLRAAMADGARNACALLDVHTQAGAAHFMDDGAPPEHYEAPLPAKTIRALAEPVPGIARVVQPYPSGQGRPAEGDEAFRTRAAERLRHKHRASSAWDYEALVLERFAHVHKVKCIPASHTEGGPGTVRLVIIPDIRNDRSGDPLAPRAPARLLDEIAAYLAPLIPPTARVQVDHASFVRVRVRIGVRFRDRDNEGFARRRLADRLNRYLAPWAFAEGGDIVIGQRVDSSSIVAFVDSLPFVDFVGGCRLFVSDDGESFRPGNGDGESVETERADGVLTPASRHEIDVIAEDGFEPTEFAGIGYMKVELDFVVAET